MWKWFSKEEYENILKLKENLTRTENKLRYYIEKFDLVSANEDKVVTDANVVLINKNKLEKIINKMGKSSDDVKDINAELEWYKVKYHEMKTGSVKTAVWILHGDGSGTCGNCKTRQKYVYDPDNYQNYCGHCGAKMHLKSEEK